MHIGNIFGADGFYWWIGVVEDRDDPLKLGRVRVRILGYHLDNPTVLPFHDLPWAVLMQPVTSAAISGKGSTPLGPLPGTWCIGFFADGKDCQVPVVMGTIAGQPEGVGKPGGCGPASNPNGATDSNGNPVTDGNGNPVATNPGGTVGNLSESELANLRETIGKRESGGNYSIVNQIGYVGKYQFGASALQSVGMVSGAKNNAALNGNVWTGKYGCNSMEDWKANKNGCQDQAMNDLLKQNYSTLNRIGVLNANSSKEETAGYLTVSHLLGAGGARDLKNGVVGKDANGTTGSSYYKLGSNAVGGGNAPPNGAAPGVNTTGSGGGDPAGKLNDPAVGESNPFGDPNGQYPSCDYSGEADTNKLARGTSGEGSDLKGTIVEKREKDLTTKIPTASPAGDGPTWDEPKPAYNAQYPYNKVKESEAGHTFEVDDTPGNERIMQYHKSGTNYEIDATGTKREKIKGEKYQIVERDNYLYIKGKSTETIGGEWSLLIQDNATIEIAGKCLVLIKNDATVNISGKADVTVKEDATIQAKNINMSAQQDINIRAGKSLMLQAGANANIQAGASMKLNAATMSLDAGNVSINSGGMLGGIAGALGGGVVSGALGGAVSGLTGLSGLADLAGVADLTSLGDLSGLGLDKLSGLAGFDIGKLGSLTGLNINSLGDLANVNLGALDMKSIGGLTGLDLGSIGKLAGAAGLNVPGLDQLSSLGGAQLANALNGDLGKALGGLSLSSFDGFNLSKLGAVAGVDVSKLTSMVGIKDLANIGNLGNIGNQLGLSNVLNATSLEGLNVGGLKLPSFNPANLASFSPQGLVAGLTGNSQSFLQTNLNLGTIMPQELAAGNNLLKAANTNLSSTLGSQLGGILGKFTGGTINPTALIGQVTQGLTSGKGVGSVIAGLVGNSGNINGVLSSLTGKTNLGMSYDFSPVSSLVQQRPVVNEFEGFTNFPPVIQLSKNFNLGDLTTRVAEASMQNKLVPQVGLGQADIAYNLKGLAVNVLDPIKDKFPNTQVVTGFVQSQENHVFAQGLGTNIQFFGASETDYFNYAQWIKNNVAYDQMVLNYKTTGDEHPWIFLSYNPDGNRDHAATDKVLTFLNNTKATDGLVDLAHLQA